MRWRVHGNLSPLFTKFKAWNSSHRTIKHRTDGSQREELGFQWHYTLLFLQNTAILDFTNQRATKMPPLLYPHSIKLQYLWFIDKSQEDLHFISEERKIIKKVRERKYFEYIQEPAVRKILNITREQLLQPRSRTEDQRIRYVTSFNLPNPNMRDTHINLLARTKSNSITLELVQIVYRKAPNVKDLLITGLVNKPLP